MTTYCVPYAYDRPKAGQVGGSTARCDAIIKAVDQMGIPRSECLFILSAGFSKKSVSRPIDDISVSIANQMAEYVESRGCRSRVVRLTWGTYGETLSATNNIPTNQHVIISTNLGHMPRVLLCWWFLAPEHRDKEFVLADHHFTLREYAQETIKFFTYLYRFTLGRWPR